MFVYLSLNINVLTHYIRDSMQDRYSGIAEGPPLGILLGEGGCDSYAMASGLFEQSARHPA